MKNHVSNYSFNICLILLLVLCEGCLNQGAFDFPPVEINENELYANSNIQALINAVGQAEGEIYTFKQEDNSLVECFVISSDEAGNFYKTLIVQDKLENPEYGLEIKIDLKSYYTKFNFGRKIYLKPAGLSMRKEKDKYILGYLSRGKIESIPNTLIDNHIIRSHETVMMIPRLLSLHEIENNNINTYVQIDNLQFNKGELGKTFAGEQYDRYNGERVVEQCGSGVKSLLYSSAYSDFKSIVVPPGRFQAKVVLTKDYYSEEIILMINDLSFIGASSEERCDPKIFECINTEVNGDRVIYFEDFEGFKSTNDIGQHGWLNQNLHFGNGKFKKRSAGENTFLQISAYNTNENVMDVWLVSPHIDLDNSTNERMTFKTRSTFYDGRILTVWISNDFEGDIEAANWELLDIRIYEGSRDGSNKEFISSGEIDLNCLNGKINIGFQYLGSDPGKSTTYDIDNILIQGN